MNVFEAVKQNLTSTAVALGYEFLLQEHGKRLHSCIRLKVLDKYTDFIVQSPLIKGSNLRFKIYVCSVVSTVETSGTAR